MPLTVFNEACIKDVPWYEDPALLGCRSWALGCCFLVWGYLELCLVSKCSQYLLGHPMYKIMVMRFFHTQSDLSYASRSFLSTKALSRMYMEHPCLAQAVEQSSEDYTHVPYYLPLFQQVSHVTSVTCGTRVVCP